MSIDIKMWKSIFNVNTRVSLLGYVSGTSDMNREMKNILDKTNSYLELKEELTKLYDAKKMFVDFARDDSTKNALTKLDLDT